MKFQQRALNRMFPLIADFMEYQVPSVRGSRRRREGGIMPIWDAFLVAAGTEETLNGRSLDSKVLRYARRALAPDGGLCVSVTEASRIRGKGSNAFYDTGTNTFYLDDEVAAACEYILGRGCGHLDGAERFLESLLLHESVHWVRYRIGLRRRARRRIRDRFNDIGRGDHRLYEPGKFFERLAYGSDLGRDEVSSRFGKIVRRARKSLGIKNVRRGGESDRTKRGIPKWR